MEKLKPMFFKGQKVICVNSKGTFRSGKRNPLIEGKSYVIEDADTYHPDAKESEVIVLLQGVDAAFRQTNFISEAVDFRLEDEINKILHKRNTLGYE